MRAWPEFLRTTSNCCPFIQPDTAIRTNWNGLRWRGIAEVTLSLPWLQGPRSAIASVRSSFRTLRESGKVWMRAETECGSIINEKASRNREALIITGRLPTLPHSYPCSTIGAEELNYRVRDRNGWVLLARVTQ